MNEPRNPPRLKRKPNKQSKGKPTHSFFKIRPPSDPIISPFTSDGIQSSNLLKTKPHVIHNEKYVDIFKSSEESRIL